jgi:hypothetical protein
MKALRFSYNALCGIILFCVIILLTGCQFGNTVMVSKGQAGGFAQIFSGTAEYCKFTSTNEVRMSPAAQEAFVKYCADVER